MKDKFEGKAKELEGKLKGDKAKELEGKAQQGMGSAKQTGKEIAHDVEHPDRDDTTDTRDDDSPISRGEDALRQSDADLRSRDPEDR